MGDRQRDITQDPPSPGKFSGGKVHCTILRILMDFVIFGSILWIFRIFEMAITFDGDVLRR